MSALKYAPQAYNSEDPPVIHSNSATDSNARTLNLESQDFRESSSGKIEWIRNDRNTQEFGNPYVLSNSVNIGHHEFTTTDLHARQILSEEFPESPEQIRFDWATNLTPLGSIGFAIGAAVLEGTLKTGAILLLIYNVFTFFITSRDKWKAWKKSQEKAPRSKAISIEISINRMRGINNKE